MSRILIDLNDCDMLVMGYLESALILRVPSAVEWNHQCGGTLCDQERAEGVLVPFDPPSRFAELLGVFTDVVGFSPPHADSFDRACDELDLPFRCDREALAACREAWVEVVVTRAAGRQYPRILSRVPDGVRAVLIWPNSD